MRLLRMGRFVSRVGALVVRWLSPLFVLVRRVGLGAKELTVEVVGFLVRLLLPVLRPVARVVLRAGIATFGGARPFAGTVVVLAAVGVAQVVAFWVLGNEAIEEASRYMLAGVVIPASAVSFVLTVKRHRGPVEGVRLRRLAGVFLALLVVADYFVGLTRLVPLIVVSKAASVLVFGLLVRLRLSDYASPTLAAMARGTLRFERMLFALAMFGLNAWMVDLRTSNVAAALLLVTFYAPIVGTAETMLARTRRTGRLDWLLGIAGMVVCAVCYAGAGFLTVAFVDSWIVGGAIGLASTGLAMVGIWLYSGTWR